MATFDTIRIETNTVDGRFDAVAAEFPAGPAIVGRYSRCTYRQLAALAASCSAAIQERTGAIPGPVVICADERTELFALFLGVMKSGRAYVYLDPADPLTRKQSVVEKCQP